MPPLLVSAAVARGIENDQDLDRFLRNVLVSEGDRAFAAGEYTNIREKASVTHTLNPRACGDCSLCCKIMTAEQLDKPAGKWCEHCTKPGCSIYDTRPQQCRDFVCMWAQADDAVPEEFRPDRVGVVMTSPVGGEEGVVLHVDPTRPLAYRDGAFGQFIWRIVQKGLPVFVVIGKKRKLFATQMPTLPDSVKGSL